jgi:hypothetical protein
VTVGRTIPVRYLFNRDCPSHEEGLELLDRAAAQAGVEIEVSAHEVTDDGEAARLSFYGSPTYIVDGRDPYAPPHGVPTAAQACRAYRSGPDRMGPLPDVDSLAEALSSARGLVGQAS